MPFYNSTSLDYSGSNVRRQESENGLPYKIKNRAGRHVEGQSRYDPVLDLKNWSRDSIDPKMKCLTPFALQTALQHSYKKP